MNPPQTIIMLGASLDSRRGIVSVVQVYRSRSLLRNGQLTVSQQLAIEEAIFRSKSGYPVAARGGRYRSFDCPQIPQSDSYPLAY